MNNFSRFILGACAAAAFSCNLPHKASAQSAPINKPVLKTPTDTLAYMMGASLTEGLKEYATTRLGVDSTCMAEFMRGITEGTKDLSAKEKAYMAGRQIGQQVNGEMFNGMVQQILQGDTAIHIDKQLFLDGFFATLQGTGLVPAASAAQYMEKNVERIKASAFEAQYAEWKKTNEDFLIANKKKEGVITTPSGLQYKILVKGTGEIPTDTTTVKVHYKGSFIDGTVFDSSYERGEPTTFVADQVIKGWTEALKLMPVGSKWELYIPQELAYGATPRGKIKPFSTLVFEVELVGIEK